MRLLYCYEDVMRLLMFYEMNLHENTHTQQLYHITVQEM